ncbi:hypothetical protein L209DRAFT_751235 [Thermothelomyces heterothallicus CBS 203.75]
MSRSIPASRAELASLLLLIGGGPAKGRESTTFGFPRIARAQQEGEALFEVLSTSLYKIGPPKTFDGCFLYLSMMNSRQVSAGWEHGVDQERRKTLLLINRQLPRPWRPLHASKAGLCLGFRRRFTTSLPEI